MIGNLRELLVEILHTKEGAKVAVLCAMYGSVKDRKAIIKSFKGYVPAVAKEEFGNMALLAILNVTDDTQLVQKTIIQVPNSYQIVFMFFFFFNF